MAFLLTSPAFKHGQMIPDRYARDGDNLSPPLRWSGAPNAAKSFALVVEDPDAPSGVFRHWAAHGIPRERSDLPEGAGRAAADALRHQAVNDFGDPYYDGPAPPRGDSPHHYHFRIAALDVADLDLPPDATAADVWEAARAHAIDEAELIGAYQRP
jgi:hypothetical protein